MQGRHALLVGDVNGNASRSHPVEVLPQLAQVASVGSGMHTSEQQLVDPADVDGASVGTAEVEA